MLNTSSLTLLDLINDILDYSKIEAGRFRTATEPMKMMGIAADVESTFRVKAEQRGLRFQLEIDLSPNHGDRNGTSSNRYWIT